MGIFDFLTGEFIDVIHWVDDTRDTMVWRFEREDHEIKYGAKLTVREGQAAVFIHAAIRKSLFLKKYASLLVLMPKRSHLMN